MTQNRFNWDEYRDRYRMDWERTPSNRPWQDVEPGFRYGWESAVDERYRGRGYSDVEPDLQRGWSTYAQSRSGTTGTQFERSWDQFKENVRQGWERAKQEFRDTF